MAVMGLSTAGQIFLQMAFLSVLARLLAPKDFGLVAGAMIAVNLTVVLAESGVGAALVQRAELTREHIRVGWTLSVLVGLASWLVLAALAPWLEHVLRLPGLAPLLRVLSLVFVVNSLTLGQYLLSRQLHFGRLAAAELISYLVGYGGVAIVMALQGYGPWSIVGGQLGQSVIRSVLLMVMAPHSVVPSLSRGPLLQLVRFGGGYSIGRILLWAATQADNLVVARTLGPAALGLYGRAYQLVQLPANLLGQVANEVLFPAMSSVQDDRATLRRIFRLGVAVTAALAVPISVLASLTSRPLVLLLLGRDWLPLLTVFDVIIFGLLFRTSSKLSDAVAKATGAVYRRAWRSLAFAAMVITGAAVGQTHGLYGVAVGVLAALAANYLVTNHLCLQIVGMSWRDFAKDHSAALVLGVTAGIVGKGAQLAIGGHSRASIVELAVVWVSAGVACCVVVRLGASTRRLSGPADLLLEVGAFLPSRAARGLSAALGRAPRPPREEPVPSAAGPRHSPARDRSHGR